MPTTQVERRSFATHEGERQLDDKAFAEFRSLIYDVCGISLGENKRALVAARVAKRLRALQMNCFHDYLAYVRSGQNPDEITDLIDVVSTNVTSFFREDNHFAFLAEQLQRWYAAGQRRFRIWCAASSSGEEPYTLAMTACEALGTGNGVDVRILATDISTKVLRAAQIGEYRAKDLGGVPQPLLQKYFLPAHDKRDGSRVVCDELRNMVIFRRINLAEPPFALRGPLDCVFCRNVMIYFDNEVRTRLVNEIHRVLRPGGFLMIGHAESLSGLPVRFRSVRPALYGRD